MNSLEVETKGLNGEGRNIHNGITITKIWGMIDGYALTILVLLEKSNDSEGFRIDLEHYTFFTNNSDHQDEDDFGVSDDDSIIDILLFVINDVRVRVNTMEIINNLPITNADISNNLLSRLPIKDSSVASSMTVSSCKVASRRKGRRN